MDKTVSEHPIVLEKLVILNSVIKVNCKVNQKSGMCLFEQRCVLSINPAIKNILTLDTGIYLPSQYN